MTGAIASFSIVPWTVAMMKPTNDILQGKKGDVTSARITELLNKWTALHNVRIALSAVALGCGLIALV